VNAASLAGNWVDHLRDHSMCPRMPTKGVVKIEQRNVQLSVSLEIHLRESAFDGTTFSPEAMSYRQT